MVKPRTKGLSLLGSGDSGSSIRLAYPLQRVVRSLYIPKIVPKLRDYRNHFEHFQSQFPIAMSSHMFPCLA